MRFSLRQQKRSLWQFNMTPLIDVTFLLLTYFMLASHFSTNERPDMKVPVPDSSQAVEKQFEDRIVINMIHAGDATAPRLTFGAVDVDSVEELSSRLLALGQSNPGVEVILRADRRLEYGEVRKVMETVAGANLGKLQVVAEVERPR